MRTFKSWQTDDNAIVYDFFNETGEARIVDKDTGEALYLTATDIKRLMECVERFEALTRPAKERK